MHGRCFLYFLIFGSYLISDSLCCEYSFCGWKSDNTQAKTKWRRHGSGEFNAFISNENDSLILLSPIYDRVLAETGCLFSSFHIENTGGYIFRIYQIPVNVAYKQLLQNNETRQDYVLFEMGTRMASFRTHFSPVITLKKFDRDFQIVLEVIATSDRYVNPEINNITILQGSNCTSAQMVAVTPSSDTFEEYYVYLYTTTTTTPPPTTTAQTSEDVKDYLSCESNQSFCDWSNDPQAKTKWHRNGSGHLTAYLSNENDSLILLSPIYDRVLAETGCLFSNFNIENMGGYIFRIYQVPVNVAYKQLLQNNETRQDYVLFEIRTGRASYKRQFAPVITLKKFDHDFQIILEVIAASDLYVNPEIEDIPLLQGSDCTSAEMIAIHPHSDDFEEYYIYTTTTTTPPPTTTTQTREEVKDYLSCESNQSFCDWSNDPQAKTKWHRNGSGHLTAYLSNENVSLILLSPIYDRVLAETGCLFSNFNIENMGGYIFRIYQVPVNVAYKQLLQNNETRQDYVLFEIRTGRASYKRQFAPVITLKKFDHDFQIILEVIAASDLYVNPEIEDIPLLQGSDCTSAEMIAIHPHSDDFEEYYIYTTTTTTPPPTTTTQTREEVKDYLSCESNQSFCDWSNDPQAKTKWHRNGSGHLTAYLSNENDSLILLSPIYDRVLAETGCLFSNFNIENMGGYIFRIYQVPVNVAYKQLLQNNETRQDYVLFEIRTGRASYKRHFAPVITLKKFDHDFQIILEVIAASDLYVNPEIEDIPILQGSDCTSAEMIAIHPHSDDFEEYYIYTTTTTTPPPTTTTQTREEVKDFVKETDVNETITTQLQQQTRPKTTVSSDIKTDISTTTPSALMMSPLVTSDQQSSIVQLLAKMSFPSTITQYPPGLNGIHPKVVEWIVRTYY
ncbi:uncharacterized protein LOC112046376 isoform X2 [Bicyclus anynana]|uniref:Uncharacterized protein LOC112046376 isoform X2 n=1 Tax=Bicyclus anynana TaxID=110368 RepID=A0ABM3LR30_BICAN|nr:uncharacterized protein LOC112046376 isoform X2 [Bicyclus anynana]